MENQPQYLIDALETAGISLDEPKRIIQTISRFTPLFDAVIEQYHDETRAAVHGAMWRYCQMEDGICKASLRTIAERIGVTVATVIRHVEILVEDGYFVDLTPDLRNKPHVYADTGRIVMISTLSAGVAQKNSSVAQKNSSVAQSQLSKDSKKDSEEYKERGASAKPPKTTIKASDFPSNVLYREVTERYPAKANWHTVLKHVDGITRRLGRTPTKDDLFPFYEAWCGMGWNTQSINWLEYAVRGDMPKSVNGKRPAPTPAPSVDPERYQAALQQAQSLIGATP